MKKSCSFTAYGPSLLLIFRSPFIHPKSFSYLASPLETLETELHAYTFNIEEDNIEICKGKATTSGYSDPELEEMTAFCAIGSSELLFLQTRLFPITRTNVSFPGRVIVCRAKLETADLGIDLSVSVRAVPPTLIAAEKEEAKAVLTLFLKKHGLSNAAASRTINKSDLFIEHLVSRLHSVHKSRYLVGRELTTLEIRDALIPYLESLLDENDKTVVNVVENFLDPPVIQAAQGPSEPFPLVSEKVGELASGSRKLRALARVSETIPPEKLPEHVIYLIELGMDLGKIQKVIHTFPAFSYYSLEGKVKPVVEFLLDLGVLRSDIPTILCKRPQLCGISLSENLIPTMKFLEGFGLDKKQWAKIICRFPAILTYSRQKLKSTVGFLCEMGLSEENIGKVLTRCPNIISYSIEEKLRPTAVYFLSMGVDVSILLHRSPQTFGLSIEGNLKPVTEFFLEKGYTMQEVVTMIQRYSTLYTFSLTDNLIPKWEFFLTMGYPQSELVKFPQYFGYSLVDRIKPRYEYLRQLGVKLLLNQVLSLSITEFDKAVERKLKKMRCGSGTS